MTINGGETLLPVSVLLPALRSDMDRLPLPPDMATATTVATNQPSTDGSSAALAAASSREATQMQQQGGAQRRYLTCCVRLSPEKEAHRFVALIEAMARPAPTGRATGASPAAVSGAGDAESVGSPRSQLEAVGVVPLMCGAASTEYGAALQARLLAAAPCAVVESRFLPPAELAKVDPPIAACTASWHWHCAAATCLVQRESKGLYTLRFEHACRCVHSWRRSGAG